MIIFKYLYFTISLAIIIFIFSYYKSFLNSNSCSIDCKKLRDCLPFPNVNEKSCFLRGCCWEKQNVTNMPYCFFPQNFKAYYEILWAKRFNNYNTIYLKNVKCPLAKCLDKLLYIYQNNSILQLKLQDHMDLSYYPSLSNIVSGYNFTILKDKINIIANKTCLFSLDISTALFSNNFNEITFFPYTNNVFGIGENYWDFKLNFNWTSLTMFASDQYPMDKSNIYGSQPFYLAVQKGVSYGILLKNTYPLEYKLSPYPAITNRIYGPGSLEFSVFLGPTPSNVISQFINYVGNPFMPPYWSLGFHLSRFGYRTMNNLNATLNRNLRLGIPIDVQWTDIDVMDANRDFTYDPSRFGQFPVFLRSLRIMGMKYIPIIDAAIKYYPSNGTDSNYSPFIEGLGYDLFIKRGGNGRSVSNETLLIGKVWPGQTVWPDFTHPAVLEYWHNQFRHFERNLNMVSNDDTYSSIIKIDGVWLDMNEPSNFVDGSIEGCSKNSLNNPPHVPRINSGKLYYKTICMDALHYNNTPHFALHNTYGTIEANVTYQVLLKMYPGKRPFIISRSNYIGLGKFAGHWSGDIVSDFEGLRKSVSSMLNYNLFGVPMTGSDICGFNGNTTAELCTRWFQLGSFYPLARSHNTDDAVDQDPAAFEETFPILIPSTKTALLTRYSLLPYLYTLFWLASTKGSTVVRPLFFEFAEEEATYDVIYQFMWGPCLLISPVLFQKTFTVPAYFPSGTKWYDFYNGSSIMGRGHTINLDAPIHRINLHVRGGCIVPMQEPGPNVKISRRNDFWLLLALDSNEYASGTLYIDDGESLLSEIYDLISFTLSNRTLISQPLILRYDPLEAHLSTHLSNVTMFGVSKKPHAVILNSSQELKFTYKELNKVLYVTNISIDITQPFNLTLT